MPNHKKAAALLNIYGLLVKKSQDKSWLQNVGSGSTRLLGMVGTSGWKQKMTQLRGRADGGDAGANEILSMVGMATTALGASLGLGASHLIGTGEGRHGLGAAAGAAVAQLPGMLETAGSP